MTYECPDIPDYLEKAEVDENEGNHELIMPHLAELLSMYRCAKNGNFRQAEELAKLYESGDLPCGPNMRTAIEWLQYATQIGSVNSGLRLAKLGKWIGSVDIAYFICKTISNVLSSNSSDSQDFNVAAQAALQLLDLKLNSRQKDLVRELLDHKKNDGSS